MNLIKTNTILLSAGLLLLAGSVLGAYDPTWSRSQCATYSYHGVHERYVRGGTMGWIDNDRWDDPSVEGLDCSSYVSRCLAIPNYVGENERAPYPYDPGPLYHGVPHMVEVHNVADLQPYDIWVWMAKYGGPSNQHTGFFIRFSGSYMVTREALNENNGIVEKTYRTQSMIDWGCRFWRRENWATATQEPTVETNAATAVLDTSATLKGTITDPGGGTITDRGFVWGTTSACDDGFLNGTLIDTDTFSASLEGLKANTRYYFQAMAQNAEGWGTGQVLSFVTEETPAGPLIVIDNGHSGTSSTGAWGVSGGPDPYGTNSLWARDGATYTWRFTPQPAGVYEVSMWWTEYTSRGTSIPVAINHAGGTTQTAVNQRTDGGQWNSLGQFTFNDTGSVTLTANLPSPYSHCADAVKFEWVDSTPQNQTPQAILDSISPSVATAGQEVTLSGHGTDDGTITAYQWVSNLDSTIGNTAVVKTSTLSEGTHTIYFRVRDDQDVWSAYVQDTVTIDSPPNSTPDTIIDNGDAATSSTGTWDVSGGADPWDENSLWGRNGATYSWTPTLTPGTYDVYMWWTEYYSRSNNATVRINHADGYADVSVNQQTNGGQWNKLGQFDFGSTGEVTLYATSGYPTSYSADAVRFIKVTPSVTITPDFVANPKTGQSPLSVAFVDQSTASETITAWRWDFDGDGDYDSSQKNPMYTYTTPGLYSVSLTVFTDSGSEQIIDTDLIEVLPEAVSEEIIVDNGDSGTYSSGTWDVSSGTNPYGANSLWARDSGSYVWPVVPQQGGTYQVYMWWTDFDSRSAAAPVKVIDADGTSNMTVNQQTNGGQWNSLGTFRMNAGQTYYVVVSASGDGATVCADAVRIVRISD